MSDSPRTSALASRHQALGSDLEDWNDMGTAWSYTTDPNDEHDAVREAAGLFDMSPLKKVYVRGPDALQVVDYMISRDMTKVAPGHSVYGSILTDQGTLADDAIIANNGNNEYLYCHGSGDSMALLQAAAQGLDVSIELDDDLHNIAVQGPLALDLINANTTSDVAQMGYFQHQQVELCGHSVRLSRTGYSGERGYEIFCSAQQAPLLWDALLEQGADKGVMACSFTALDKVRIEAGLLFYGYDMTEDNTPWEVGLGFTVNRTKADYRGKQAALASEASPKLVGAGIGINGEQPLEGGETLWLNGEEVGVVNSPGFSHRLGQTLALVHIQASANTAGTELEVRSEGYNGTANIASLPFYDPQKSRTHAE